MTRPRNPIALQLLIAIGVALATAGVVLHLALPKQYERVEIIPIVVGFALALFGAYWMDPERAKKAAHGVAETGAEVVHSVVELRTGDRKTDPIVRIEKTSNPAHPEAGDAVNVSVTTASPGTASVPITPVVPDAPAPDIPPTGGFPTREGA